MWDGNMEIGMNIGGEDLVEREPMWDGNVVLACGSISTTNS